MLVPRREYEKKAKGADEGWPLMARAIDNPLEKLPRNRSCNWIAVLANSVTVSCEARRTASLLTRGMGAAHSKMSMTSLLDGGVGVDGRFGSGRCAGRNLESDGELEQQADKLQLEGEEAYQWMASLTGSLWREEMGEEGMTINADSSSSFIRYVRTYVPYYNYAMTIV